jgi:hypothetical protein
MYTHAPHNASYLPGRGRTFPASQRQLDFLRSLREEIARLKNSMVAPEAQVTGDVLERWISTDDVAADKAACSVKIENAIAWRDRLRVEAKQHAAEAPHSPEHQRREVTEGMWIVGDIHNGDIFKVQIAVHGTGNLYAKRFIPGDIVDGEREKGTFVYTPGAMKLLAAEGRKMTMAEAKEYGALYGTCCRCGRTLTKEKSIERGIGPVCGKYFD